MRIAEIYRQKSFGLSIEVFPPKTSKGDETLLETLRHLTRYQPDFVSCTYGAGGGTQNRTIEWCVNIQEQFGATATAHFTCVNATRDELLQWLSRATESGITNIMALRGDPPQGEQTFKAVEGGFRNANQLVALIRENFPDLGIGVAGYPEKHQECPDPQTDLMNLKRKVDAGANAVFTQLFYVNDNFFKFRERYEQAGIDLPLIPGIMPITEFSRIKRITDMCGAVFPVDLASRLEAVQDDPQAQFDIGVEHAIGQCRELVDRGVPGIHFYALNRSQSCERILNALDLVPPRIDSA